jgi:hypothetical protein
MWQYERKEKSIQDFGGEIGKKLRLIDLSVDKRTIIKFILRKYDEIA